MKLIINTEIIKGYENLKNIFLSVDQIREKYILKYGSMDAFKEKIRVEREKFIAEIKSRSENQ